LLALLVAILQLSQQIKGSLLGVVELLLELQNVCRSCRQFFFQLVLLMTHLLVLAAGRFKLCLDVLVTLQSGLQL
jgi:hypothetical protein